MLALPTITITSAYGNNAQIEKNLGAYFDSGGNDLFIN